MELLPPVGGDQNRGPALVTVTWFFTALALMTVSTKLYTRYRIIQHVGLDDFFIFFSTVLIVICTAIITADVHLGMGRHEYYLTPEQRVQAVRTNLIANPFGIMAYSLPNISVAIFLVKMINPNKWQTWTIYTVTIAQSIIAGISCLLLFAQCIPSRALWDPSALATARCLPSSVITGYSYFVGEYSAFTDVFLAVIPINAFWSLQMKTKTKISLCLLMGMTAVAAICAIVKTTKLNELAELADFTYATTDLLIWAVVEANVIIIAACIPSLRPFVVSVSQSMSVNHSLAWLRSKGYNTHESAKPLALDLMPLGTDPNTKRTNNISFVASEGSLPPSKNIKETTELETEWEQVV